MKEHDQRFKTLLREFFPHLLALFFPQCAAGVDLATVRWHDKELIHDPPRGEVLAVDLLAEVRCRPAPDGAPPPHPETLYHLEVESRDAVAQFPERMYKYHGPIRARHGKPVVPIAVYLRVGLEGIGEGTYVESVVGLNVLTFRYLYVGLPALDAEQYLRGDNWLGVALAALMRADRERKPAIRAEALWRIVIECRENEYRKQLLIECVQAYANLDAEQRREFQRLLESERYREVTMVALTWKEEGIELGLRQAVQVQLEHRFGALEPPVRERLQQLPITRVRELLLEILTAPSLKALGLED